MPSDIELVQGIKNGKEKSLEELYKRYYHDLCDFAVRFVDDSHLAEEVVSDVFVNIWIKRETLNFDDNVKPYLYVATRNQSLNFIRKEKKLHIDLDEVSGSDIPTSYSTTDNFSFKELEKEIEELIKKLPEQRQLIFTLNRFEGLKYKEIADILGISPNTVQNQMVEAVKFMTSQYPKVASNWQLAYLLLCTLPC